MKWLSAGAGAAMRAIGSNLVLPMGPQIGSVIDLVGVATIIVSVGLADGD